MTQPVLTEEQAAEIMRRASLWATARCRAAVVSLGHAGPGETPLNTTERKQKAEAHLLEYLRELGGIK